MLISYLPVALRKFNLSSYSSINNKTYEWLDTLVLELLHYLNQTYLSISEGHSDAVGGGESPSRLPGRPQLFHGRASRSSRTGGLQRPHAEYVRILSGLLFE